MGDPEEHNLGGQQNRSKASATGFRIAGIAGGFLILGLLLYPVFSGRVVLPQLFSIGPITIHYYGIIIAFAALVGWVLALRRAPQFGLPVEQAERIIFICLIAGFLGARLYHVALAWPYYADHPGQILALWNGGLGIYGTIFGGAAALLYFAWRKADSGRIVQPVARTFLSYLNWLAFSVLAGQIIGRFGNLFNYEAYGAPTDLPWKLFVPEAFRYEASYGGFSAPAFYHPWFLYEALFNLLIFVVLWRWKRFSNDLFLWYMLLYTVSRLFLEFYRADSVFIGPIRLNVVISAVIALITGIVLFYGKPYLSQNSQRNN